MLRLDEPNLVPLRDVPRLLPARSSGKRVHISAVYRWAQRGVHGVRLETIRVGGTTYTSGEALQKFAEELTARRVPGTHEAPAARPSRERELRNAASRLEVELGMPPGWLASKEAAHNAREGVADHRARGRAGSARPNGCAERPPGGER